MVRINKHTKKNPKKVKRVIKRKPQVAKTQIIPKTAAPNNIVKDQNTIRNMLLMRTGLIPPGYIPQQYGNANDKINTLQLTESSLKDQNLRQKKEIEELSKNIAELKKERREVNSEHYKAENEYDKLIAEVEEAKRVKGKTELLQEKARHLKQQYEEVSSENRILPLQKSIDAMQTEINLANHENANLNRVIKENKLKEEIEKLKVEREKIMAENTGMREYMNSREFKDPGGEMADIYNNLLKEKARKQYYEKMIELQNENVDLQLKKSEMEAQNYTVTKNDEHAIQNQIRENSKLQEEIRNAEARKNKYQHKMTMLNKLEMENLDIQLKKDKLDAELDGMPTDIASDLKSEIQNEAKAEIANEETEAKLNSKKKARNSERNKIYFESKADSYTTPEIMDTEKEITRSIIETAHNEQAARKYDLLHKTLEQENKSANETFIAKETALGHDNAALATQLAAVEESKDKLNQEEQNIISNFSKKTKEVNRIKSSIPVLQEEKTRQDPYATFDNYVKENIFTNPRLTELDVVSPDEMREIVSNYQNWWPNVVEEEEENDGWSNTKNDTKTNNNNNNFSYIRKAKEYSSDED